MRTHSDLFDPYPVNSQYKFMDAERDYYSKLAQRLISGDAPALAAPCVGRAKSPLIEQISHAR